MAKNKLVVEITTTNTFGNTVTKTIKFNDEQHLDNYIAKIERAGVKVRGIKTMEQ